MLILLAIAAMIVAIIVIVYYSTAPMTDKIMNILLVCVAFGIALAVLPSNPNNSVFNDAPIAMGYYAPPTSNNVSVTGGAGCTPKDFEDTFNNAVGKTKQESKVRHILNCFVSDGEFVPVNPKDKDFPKWLVDYNEDGSRTQLSLDGYNRKLKIAFEFQGWGHYANTFGDNMYSFLTARNNDRIKLENAKNNGIKTIIVHCAVPVAAYEDYVKSRLQDIGALKEGTVFKYMPVIAEPPKKYAETVEGAAVNRAKGTIKLKSGEILMKDGTRIAAPQQEQPVQQYQLRPINFAPPYGMLPAHGMEYAKQIYLSIPPQVRGAYAVDYNNMMNYLYGEHQKHLQAMSVIEQQRRYIEQQQGYSMPQLYDPMQGYMPRQ